jgi:hypothetical protein
VATFTLHQILGVYDDQTKEDEMGCAVACIEANINEYIILVGKRERKMGGHCTETDLTR